MEDLAMQRELIALGKLSKQQSMPSASAVASNIICHEHWGDFLSVWSFIKAFR